MKKHKSLFFTILFSLLFTGASLAEDALHVAVSIPPQKYFVEKLGGDLVAVEVLIPPGTDPHVFQLKPEKIRALHQSEIYFTVGADFEFVLLEKIQDLKSQLKIISTKAAVNTHPEGTLSDPHTWLSPSHVKIQAKNILDTLIASRPEKKDIFQKNYHTFLVEIETLHHQLQNLLGQKKRTNIFLTTHGAWGHFAENYALREISISTEGKEPNPKTLIQLIEQSKQNGINTVFVSPQYPIKSAKTIADSIGGEIVPIDPLAENWADNLMATAQKIYESLK